MVTLIYKKLAPYLAPFFLFIIVVLAAVCVWRGEVILGLQAELIKDKKQEVKVVIEQQENANKISLAYEQDKVGRQQEKVYVDREVEKIVTVPSYSNLCFDVSGMRVLNNYITSLNSSRESSGGMSTTTGVE